MRDRTPRCIECRGGYCPFFTITNTGVKECMRQEKLSTSKKKTYATTAEVHAALMRLGAEIADIADTEFGNGYKVVISNGKIDVLYSEIGFPIGFEEE